MEDVRKLDIKAKNGVFWTEDNSGIYYTSANGRKYQILEMVNPSNKTLEIDGSFEEVASIFEVIDDAPFFRFVSFFYYCVDLGSDDDADFIEQAVKDYESKRGANVQ